MYNQWATAPGRSLNSPRPKSIAHLCTFSDNGVYVALQLFCYPSSFRLKSEIMDEEMNYSHIIQIIIIQQYYLMCLRFLVR